MNLVTTDSNKTEVFGPDPEIIELTKAILRQHEKIIMSNIQLLERLSNPVVFFQNPTSQSDEKGQK